MNRHSEKGLTIVLVLAVLALLAGSFVILTGVSGMITSQTQSRYMDGCRKNLQASAAAWVQYQQGHAAWDITAPRSLEVAALGIPGGEITIRPMTPQKPGVEIFIHCQKGRWSRTETCVIEGKPLDSR